MQQLAVSGMRVQVKSLSIQSFNLGNSFTPPVASTSFDKRLFYSSIAVFFGNTGNLTIARLIAILFPASLHLKTVLK